MKQPERHAVAGSANSIFTNCALTPDGDVYWEEMSDEEPDGADGLDPPPLAPGLRPHRRASERALHRAGPPVPGDRRRVGRSRRACRSAPSSSAAGARRVVPLVTEAFDWQHGTFLGSIMASEKTAAAAGKVGELRRDPMAMLPFCGYHMGDYFAHWLKIGEKAAPRDATGTCRGSST